MKYFGRSIFLAIICWVAAPTDAQAALCPMEVWNQSTGALNFKTGDTQVLMRGTAAITHDSANHTNSCVGTIYLTMILGNAASITCNDTGGNQPVTYQTTHALTREKTCSNLPRGFTYSTNMEFWWSNDEHDFADAIGIYITRDDDSDGHDETEDCDDSVGGVWDYCPDQDDDGHYANYDDCDDNNNAIWGDESACDEYECEVVQHLYWDGYACYTPVLIGRNLLEALTDVDNGVVFDIAGTGKPRRVAWTRANSRAGWLALDRNANGRIDNGSELFGNVTPQPDHPRKNGFLALATFDDNRDGWIDRLDPIFRHLRLWVDVNHDGVSHPSELRTLASEGIQRLSVEFKVTRKADQHGNQFRYKARVDDASGASLDNFAWDVTLRSMRLAITTDRQDR